MEDLGLASIQIVHDLKNQLNGFKLYATFLRRRMETSERPADELEVIDKLIAGIERTAAELTILVRYGRPISITARPDVRLSVILSSLRNQEVGGEDVRLDVDDDSIRGEYDIVALTEALQSITNGALTMLKTSDTLLIRQCRNDETPNSHVLIEWRNVETGERDVFRSLAGADALRLALAAKIVEAHGGTAVQQPGLLRVSLPVQVCD